MSPKPILLLIGMGARTGAHIASKFVSIGYHVAVTARSLEDGTTDKDGNFNIKADLAEPATIPAVFEKVKAKFGAGPSVVVYTAYSLTWAPNEPLDLPLPSIQRDLTVNIASTYAAAAEAVKHFSELPPSLEKTFMFVGNNQTHVPYPPMISLGLGKCACAHMMACSAVAYKEKGFRFYYVDQRTPEGGSMGANVNGPAHAEFLAQLAADKEQGPWEATFVDGKGYVRFD